MGGGGLPKNIYIYFSSGAGLGVPNKNIFLYLFLGGCGLACVARRFARTANLCRGRGSESGLNPKKLIFSSEAYSSHTKQITSAASKWLRVPEGGGKGGDK